MRTQRHVSIVVRVSASRSALESVFSKSIFQSRCNSRSAVCISISVRINHAIRINTDIRINRVVSVLVSVVLVFVSIRLRISSRMSISTNISIISIRSCVGLSAGATAGSRHYEPGVSISISTGVWCQHQYQYWCLVSASVSVVVSGVCISTSVDAWCQYQCQHWCLVASTLVSGETGSSAEW